MHKILMVGHLCIVQVNFYHEKSKELKFGMESKFGTKINVRSKFRFFTLFSM
jgi:hypothetical protein